MKTCRHCNAPLTRTFVDLGSMPLANSYVSPEDADGPEREYPLHVMVCDQCLLVQLDTTVPPEEIFSGGYDYFSSTSPSWVQEAARKAGYLTSKFNLGKDSLVVEVGSNDGYLLRHFAELGVGVLGVDPAEDCADEAIAYGVPTVVEFFGKEVAEQLVKCGYRPDIVTGTNVFAHCPDINDFVAGLAILVKPEGVVIMEFPHLLTLIEGVQFDTIYHEHYFYFSLLAVMNVFEAHGLQVYDVEELPTHGGSLRVYARTDMEKVWTPSMCDVLRREGDARLHTPEGYDGFAEKVKSVARNTRHCLNHISICEDATIAAYGAPAKGSTFLNYCDVPGLIDFTVDDSPHKQGKLMPGSGIPIMSREHLIAERPDYVLCLPWNLLEPIRARNPEVEAWGGRWVTAIPEIKVHDPI